MQIQPHLFYDGRCEEAAEFHRRALGAEATLLVRFKDSPADHEPGMVPPTAGDKVMHMSIRIGDTSVLVLGRSMPGAPGLPGIFAGAHGAQ